LPSKDTDKKNAEIKTLGSWCSNQKKNYDSDIQKCKERMSRPEIKEKWEEFMTEFPHLFKKSKVVKTTQKTEKKEEEVEVEDMSENESTDSGVEESKCGSTSPDTNSYVSEESEGSYESNSDTQDTNEIKMRKTKKNECQHLWKTTSEDDVYCYKVCEKCDRKTKTCRVAKKSGYNEPNPVKKHEINSWLRDYPQYNEGDAIYLDAQEMKTSSHLIQNGVFQVDNLIIPEFDEETFETNKTHPVFGSRVQPGDLLETLKENRLENISLIYADFVGHYSKVVKPLLEYLQENNEKVKVGTILGFTWSNNGAGTKNERRKIIMEITRFMIINNYEEIDKVSDTGYGDGGQMNVMFLRKRVDEK